MPASGPGSDRVGGSGVLRTARSSSGAPWVTADGAEGRAMSGIRPGGAEGRTA
ncbi:hypothetical protein [Streptomyces qinglanensis]|uniref:hypothetical protein n=1 Tax=Streptomyces qinglanensis TaxID=943816 RepID=UPI0037A7F54C